MTRPDVEVMRDLLVRVKAATGADLELDARILCALAAPDGSWVDQSPFNGAWCIYDRENQSGRPSCWEMQGWFRSAGWPLTGSLDTATALLERVLPGLYRVVRFDPRLVEGLASYCALQRLWIPGDGSAQWTAEAYAATEPLAICAALLTALIAAEDRDHG